jgi:putative transposase
LRHAEGGVTVSEPCRAHGMSDASFYKWRAKYGGMDASLIGQMEVMEDARIPDCETTKSMNC